MSGRVKRTPNLILNVGVLVTIALLRPAVSLALGSCPGNQFPTPLGCVELTAAGFGAWILRLGISLGTLLAVLLLIIGGYGVATSAGNPENLEKAKSQITAAIAGLLFILLSVLILNTIGGGIIGIPFFQ